MQVAPLSRSARVSSSSAARCRYVKSTSPSRRRPNSSGSGSFTLSTRSLEAHTSSTEVSRAPTASYSASGKALPAPAPASTRTSWPRPRSSRAPAGVSATRYSSCLISLTTPICKPANDISGHKRASQPAGGVGRREERGILVRTAPHVRERKALASLPPVGGVDRLDCTDRGRDAHPLRPRDLDRAEAELEGGEGVVGDAAVALARVGLGDAGREERNPAESARGVRRL